MAQVSHNLPWDLARTKWASALNPLLALQILQGNMITGIKLVQNEPQAINHLLARNQVGWLITDTNAEASVWRTKAFNSSTLTLESNADVTINIWVF